jgi:hypothetical protein
MSSITLNFPAVTDRTLRAAARADRSTTCQPAPADWTDEKDVSELDEREAPMTLITPCSPPKHSKWHMISGALVVFVGYAALVTFVRWLVA